MKNDQDLLPVHYLAMLQRALELDGIQMGVCQFAATGGDGTLTLELTSEAYEGNVRWGQILRNGPALLHIRLRQSEGQTPVLETSDPRFMVPPLRDTDERPSSFTPKTVPALLTEVEGVIAWANRQLGQKTSAVA